MKDIEGFEGLYAVTSCGKVWSYRAKKFLNVRPDHWGYILVNLSKNGKLYTKLLARIVAKAYIPNPDPETLTQINHKDEIKAHNYIKNIEWCTAKYNCNYGTRSKRASEKKKKPVRCVETGKVYSSVNEAAKDAKRTQSMLVCALKGKAKTAGGYHWEYIS